MTPLSAQDRDFFARVQRATFANPFGTERTALDLSLADTEHDGPDVLDRLAARLGARLEALAPRDVVKLHDHRGDDRELLFAAVLFHTFHRFLSEIDTLIARDARSDTTTEVTFASEVFRTLGRHGFVARESVRMLELFFPIRRAHLAVQSRLTGTGPSMRRVREELWNALFTRDIGRYERTLWNRMEDFSILLTGETGTGKGEAARALGDAAFIPFDERRQRFAERAADMALPVHLSEFPESLIESELFGHRKGAFTGAIDHHPGVLSRVKAHGIVFLDEIGEVSLPIQVKLLRVLQDREFTPVGGHERQRFSGRVVAATHRSFDAMRAEGRIRDDFFYRLCTHTIELPSLRVRLAESEDELSHLVSRSLSRIAGEVRPELVREVSAVLMRDLGRTYPYPGNVRELEQCVRRTLLTGQCRTTRSPEMRDTLDTQLADMRLGADALLARYCAALYARHQSYVEVARITGLDRRTVKKHVADASRS